jgi:hypothetical protein
MAQLVPTNERPPLALSPTANPKQLTDVRESVDNNLLRNPFCRRVRCHVDPCELSPSQLDDDQNRRFEARHSRMPRCIKWDTKIRPSETGHQNPTSVVLFRQFGQALSSGREKSSMRISI